MSDNKFFVTNGITQDGFGARLQRCFQTMCFVYQLQAFGIPVEYVHTPFSYDEDNGINEDRSIGVSIRQNFSLANPYPYDDISHEGYMKRSKLWDAALPCKGRTVYDLNLNELSIKQGYFQLIADLENSSTANSLYVVRYTHEAYDTGRLDINFFNLYRDKILDFFSLEKINSDKKEIAIHIRRKDSIDKRGRFIEDSYYLLLLSEISKLKEKYNVTIYTQEVGFNRELYKDWNVIFDTMEDDFDTFKKLVFADHFIMGSSSFSYSAGLLNTNTVVYPFIPGSHRAINSWINAYQYLNLLKTEINNG